MYAKCSIFVLNSNLVDYIESQKTHRKHAMGNNFDPVAAILHKIFSLQKTFRE
jgi:hypothetical protein